MPYRPDDYPQAKDAETDPRFPSGRWTGFWLQRGFRGRQFMRLHLSFAAGLITGDGSDIVGDFSLAGTYELKTGRCSFHKRYVGAHVVLYEGQNQDDGKWVWGIWRIETLDRGGFHIWPAGEDDPTVHRLKREATVPAEGSERVRVLVPSIDE